jgi:hypothetical protein
MEKAPYTFPHKSRAAIAEYLTRRGRCYDYRRYAFAWNVKTHGARFDGAALRRHSPGLDPSLDSAFAAHTENDSGGLFWRWCEDAARYIGGGDWCSYPGDDQGDWDFSFAGRSGGWIVLEKWRGRDMRDVDATDFLNRDLWPWSDIVAFYRGIRCADSDFTPGKAAREVEYYAADYRDQWEEERREEAQAAARAMAAAIQDARPDLAPACA